MKNSENFRSAFRPHSETVAGTSPLALETEPEGLHAAPLAVAPTARFYSSLASQPSSSSRVEHQPLLSGARLGVGIGFRALQEPPGRTSVIGKSATF